MTNNKINVGDRVVWGREIPHEGVVVAIIKPGEMPYERVKQRFNVSHKWVLSPKVRKGIVSLSTHLEADEKLDYSKLYNRKSTREEVSYIVLAPGNVLYWPRARSLRRC